MGNIHKGKAMEEKSSRTFLETYKREKIGDKKADSAI